MANVKIWLDSDFVYQPEYIKVGIDDKQIYHIQLPQTFLEFDIKLDDGDHKFWIELCGKHEQNESRVNGQLVKDTFVLIKNLSINGSMMHYLLNDNGYTIPDWQHHRDAAEWFLSNQGQVPDRIDKSTYLNLKGVYYFHFFLPLKEYLDRHIKIDPAYKDYYNSPLDRYISLKNKLCNDSST
jgi:hypothetical protein